MDIRTALRRAKRGFRDDLRLHVWAIASLILAFLCLEAALLSVQNVARLAERWRGAQHLTVYLKDSAQAGDVAQLRLVLESLQEAQAVQHVTAEQARKEFASQVEMHVAPGSLPLDAFPASLEVLLHENVSQQRAAEIAERVRRFGPVEEVETYRDFYAQMGSLLAAGRGAVVLLALLVAVCVLAIIGNTIRLAVLNRKREIEVLKLCGATDGYVRSPFVIEGALQASAAAIAALILLLIAYFAARGQVESALSAVSSAHTVFLEPLFALAVVVGAGVMGATGSALALRRYLNV
jgi:cell division transport system permease protein